MTFALIALGASLWLLLLVLFVALARAAALGDRILRRAEIADSAIQDVAPVLGKAL